MEDTRLRDDEPPFEVDAEPLDAVSNPREARIAASFGDVETVHADGADRTECGEVGELPRLEREGVDEAAQPSQRDARRCAAAVPPQAGGDDATARGLREDDFVLRIHAASG